MMTSNLNKALFISKILFNIVLVIGFLYYSEDDVNSSDVKATNNFSDTDVNANSASSATPANTDAAQLIIAQ